MTSRETICVSEIFGPTIQGEGPLIGLPTVFVRTGGCDYRCRWCDTNYAVDNTFRRDWQMLSATEIFAKVASLAGGEPLLVSLSGGNPAMQPLADLIQLGKAEGYHFALETQGSLARSWFAALDTLILSPKPPSSGMTTDWQTLQDCVAAAEGAAVSLKIVVADEADYQFARQVARRYPQLPMYLQPCKPVLAADDPHAPAGSAADLAGMRLLIDRTLADHWYTVKILPQLHVLLWGNKRGV